MSADDFFIKTDSKKDSKKVLKEDSNKEVKEVKKRVKKKTPKEELDLLLGKEEPILIEVDPLKLVNDIFENETLNNVPIKELIIYVIKELSSIKTELSSIKKDIGENIIMKERNINEQIDVIQKLIHEKITPERAESTKKWMPSQNFAKPTSNSKFDPKKHMIIKEYKEDLIKVYGKTFDNRNVLKQIPGALFNEDDDKGWVMSRSKLNELEILLQNNSIDYVKDI